MTAMVLDREPPPGPDDIDIRRVTTSDGYRRSMEIVADAFDFDAQTRTAFVGDAEGAWRFWQTEPGRGYLLAHVDGLAVAEAGLASTIPGPVVLSGGATLPGWRGRGAYRALVRWRWDEAVRRGTPVIAVRPNAIAPEAAPVRAVVESVPAPPHVDGPRVVSIGCDFCLSSSASFTHVPCVKT